MILFDSGSPCTLKTWQLVYLFTTTHSCIFVARFCTRTSTPQLVPMKGTHSSTHQDHSVMIAFHRLKEVCIFVAV